ncbi:CYFA0S05e03070g1_1 [Cyberlindnera fabianii]|uniref:CYFA0S05e03070g1_1 n=1 Tax=Cyberlindnera fabianii TaxID=36022 RepID=A0A061ASQ9_CYBFA|nr:hypothetical protein BON22_2138 [Cyberlindnera fabianii]CDR40668.1 CYFA0S05e03070g1_1 [Cyberlindnera fabianii]
MDIVATSLLDLPNEILTQILLEINDMYEYINISMVSKRLQTLIRQIVLVCGDAPDASGFFNSIADEYLYMDTLKDHQFDSVIRKFKFFIFEFSQQARSIPPDEYLVEIAKCKTRASQKIVEVFLTQRGAEMAFADPGNVWIEYHRLGAVSEDVRLYHNWMSQVALTIFLEKSDLAVNTFINNQTYGFPSDLTRFGHEYEFRNVKELPHVYFSISSFYDFKIRSKSLEKLNGFTSSSMTEPRLPPLLKFLELSYLPNLKEIKGIAIESGLTLKIFERFEKLEVLHLQSAFTGNVELQISSDRCQVELKQLKELDISGNAMSLCNTSFPNLEKLSLHVHGAFGRNFSESLYFENITCPKLLTLHIEITSIPTGLRYILNTLSESLPYLNEVDLISNSQSFVLANDLINKLTSTSILSLSHNDLEINDLPQGPQRENYTVKTDTPDFNISLPNLTQLSLLNFDKFNNTLLSLSRAYPTLQHLGLTLRIKPAAQQYVFDEKHFPNLRELTVDYSNSYAHVQKCNIEITLDIKDLGVTFTKQVPDKVEYKQDARHVWVYVVE